jgi:hypothetical protein
LTVPRLREECKKNNLPATGKKCELQERLKTKLFKQPFPHSVKKVIFEEDANDIALDQDVSFEDEKPTAKTDIKKQLWQDADESSEPKHQTQTSKHFFQDLMNAPSAKKPSNAEASSQPARPNTAPVTTPSKMLGKSPKRKRDSDDAVKTPGSAKKFRPLGFLSSSPRCSSPPASAVAPLGNHNRTPVMFKHT